MRPTEAYPLKWPDGWERTPPSKRQKARFATSRSKSVSHLLNELRLLGAKNAVISTNIETYQRGGREIPYANQTVDDPGVAVYFVLDEEEQCMPIDRWNKVDDNLRAIGKCIEALRGLDRWGAKSFVKASFRGFKALPPPGGDSIIIGEVHKPYWEVLEIPENSPMWIVKQAYKRKAKEAHPDQGGTVEAFQRVKRAYDEAKVKLE